MKLHIKIYKPFPLEYIVTTDMYANNSYLHQGVKLRFDCCQHFITYFHIIYYPSEQPKTGPKLITVPLSPACTLPNSFLFNLLSIQENPYPYPQLDFQRLGNDLIIREGPNTK